MCNRVRVQVQFATGMPENVIMWHDRPNRTIYLNTDHPDASARLLQAALRESASGEHELLAA